jgi:hypothetical protein
MQSRALLLFITPVAPLNQAGNAKAGLFGLHTLSAMTVADGLPSQEIQPKLPGPSFPGDTSVMVYSRPTS